MIRKLALVALALLSLGLAACGDKAQTTDDRNIKFQNNVQERLERAVGRPDIKDSLELRNLKRRYELLDDANKTGYIYLIDHGLVFAEYTVKGKVSSLESSFTSNTKLDCRKIKKPGDDWNPCGAIDQAEPDGSYGKNPDGIFFWTADSVYVEWGGDYLYSEKRLDIQQPSQNIIAKPVR